MNPTFDQWKIHCDIKNVQSFYLDYIVGSNSLSVKRWLATLPRIEYPYIGTDFQIKSGVRYIITMDDIDDIYNGKVPGVEIGRRDLPFDDEIEIDGKVFDNQSDMRRIFSYVSYNYSSVDSFIKSLLSTKTKIDSEIDKLKQSVIALTQYSNTYDEDSVFEN